MLVFPNAKINIGLNIVKKRTDGYHNITSCFYPVGWSDALEIIPADVFSFHSDGSFIPGKESDNLCVKAYQMIAADYSLPPVSIHLLKIIPIGAGLGGGSSDAAFSIKAINQLFRLEISLEKQQDYARRLGSDCAFFIQNKPVFAFEKGDQFEPVDLSLKGKWIVMVNPGIHISTIEAYSGIKPEEPEYDLKLILKEPLAAWKNIVKNNFEVTLFIKYPLLENIKQDLYDFGAVYAAMSGSGSTLYGIFEKEIDLSGHFERFNVWHGALM
ncbi:4-(cytidine 5'-diphospho)-2-C-methyl-D-erythritol kinase [Dyadobacter psychrotolerans]|uniref:4-diphosphocytidyl-2-C-methyl-D-erythritol kinase n=1 Tax=Dyadobacter psychrotolerans TaxID=2541721 RepID=A0A4R5DI09_9BACT|nr:4-(cytidine 5'-diphospho)-2-C-methyl-D-erythritol kinase [Dyadobacter psychrotolerans]TDE13696.1 4-(cytidine 5'-diphospho)-2-C-methyl-D-erythritol kinase [Dyadobacter psychrotolerans]